MEIGPRRKALVTFFERIAARSPLDQADRDAVLALPGYPQTVAAHRDIVRVGEDVEHCCLVVDGLVGRFAQLEDGSRQIVALHLPGDMVGLDTLMLAQATSPLHALTNSTIIKVPHDALRDLVTRRERLPAALWRDCIVDAAIMGRWLVNVGRKNARSRIAHLLCEMALRYDQIGRVTHGTFTFPATQEQIADMVGMTAVHVNRSIKTLRDEGLIHWSRYDVTIRNWDALALVGEFDADYLCFGANRELSAELRRRML